MVVSNIVSVYKASGKKHARKTRVTNRRTPEEHFRQVYSNTEAWNINDFICYWRLLYYHQYKTRPAVSFQRACGQIKSFIQNFKRGGIVDNTLVKEAIQVYFSMQDEPPASIGLMCSAYSANIIKRNWDVPLSLHVLDAKVFAGLVAA